VSRPALTPELTSDLIHFIK